ncbi:MAG: hypothetical protein ACO2ZC_10190, partial [Pseudomonadales bacterium]
MTDNEGNDRDLPRPPALANTQATVVPRQDHPISRKAISSGAMKVLYRLLGAGHQAFLVGGGVPTVEEEFGPVGGEDSL